MVYKTVNFFLNIIIRRSVFMLLNLITFVFSFYCLKALFGFMHVFSSWSEHEIDQMSETLNGIAGVLVAIGVLMEERETIQRMIKAKVTSVETDEYLNEVAHHNGLGLLLIGLFMEIVTLIIEAPSSIINTTGIEFYLFGLCFIMVICSMLVELDLIKDYTFTYFRKPAPREKH